MPKSAFCLYPADHAGGGEVLRSTSRGMFFGDASAARRFKGDPRVEVHGPGYSKVVIGKDRIDDWQDYIEIIAASVADNGGRSCVNASGVWVTGHAEAIAHALAQRLSQVVPRAADDEQALLAPFADAGVPGRVSAMIDADLAVAGATDVTRAVSRRRACEDDGRRHVPAADGHPLRRPGAPAGQPRVPVPLRQRRARRTKTRCPMRWARAWWSRSSATTRICSDRFVRSPHVDRLNLGPIPTNQIGWDQPHEGNLFDHLYARRAIQRVA